MNIFDRLLTQPIFNLLALIYNFVGDFGVAIIILTIIVRVLLWPLVKKQLHQTKLMRQIQPELKRIKKQANGNRMLESTLMMELYKEKGIKIGGSFLVLAIQLPVFIALIGVINLFNIPKLPSVPASFAENGDTSCQKDISKYKKDEEKTFWQNYCQTARTREDRILKRETIAYPGVRDLGNVKKLTEDVENFKPKLFGAVDLTKNANDYFPALIIAILAAVFQFIQSKQIMPKSSDKKKLRDMFKSAAKGEEVDQSEMAAATTGKMMYIMPLIMFIAAIQFPAAVVLYYAITSLVAVVQQSFILKKDDKEMISIADETKKRVRTAVEAEIVEVPKKSLKTKTSETSKTPKPSGGATVVRRIKAK
ncbi:YidC/Oxa1 family membrane protein insertase [Candidatus Saccharibacteria bacterium]|nr:YidC/Oxa1 family membrane protein insertase [Candidatus Saccharibacteria bacterium]MCL1963220.1 YidC/Oxa1 family membrane protein insertase [Candidatus Saccharibacteria bacterium]